MVDTRLRFYVPRAHWMNNYVFCNIYFEGRHGGWIDLGRYEFCKEDTDDQEFILGLGVSFEFLKTLEKSLDSDDND